MDIDISLSSASPSPSPSPSLSPPLSPEYSEIQNEEEGDIPPKPTTAVTITGEIIHGLEERLKLEKCERSNVKQFRKFHDSARDLVALTADQVVLSVDIFMEAGVQSDLYNIFTIPTAPGALVPRKIQKFSKSTLHWHAYSVSPRFLPLDISYTAPSNVPMVTLYSHLNKFMGGVELNNNVTTTWYRKMMPYFRMKKPVTGNNVNMTTIPRNTVVIKHPVLKWSSRATIHMKFIILKKINYKGSVLGVVREKMLKLWRKKNLWQFWIRMEEGPFSSLKPLCGCDMKYDKHQHPVISTDLGMLPLAHHKTTEYHVQSHSLRQQPLFKYTIYEKESEGVLRLASVPVLGPAIESGGSGEPSSATSD